MPKSLAPLTCDRALKYLLLQHFTPREGDDHVIAASQLLHYIRFRNNMTSFVVLKVFSTRCISQNIAMSIVFAILDMIRFLSF